MNIYRGAVLGMLAVIAMALIGILLKQPHGGVMGEPHQSRAEKLREACEAHPADCLVMQRSRAAAEYEMNQALRTPTPAVKASVDDLEKALRGYEDRFIATGKYGE